MASMPETKQKIRRQVIEEARRAALDGNWDAAIEINRELIARDPKDSAAYNRLGRAFLERRDYAAAYEAYSDALKSDPANLISRRNLQRLEHLRSAKEPGQDAPATEFPRTLVFIEEVGKTWVDELVNPEPMAELAEIYAGQKLELVPEGNRLAVHDSSGRRIGEIEASRASHAAHGRWQCLRSLCARTVVRVDPNHLARGASRSCPGRPDLVPTPDRGHAQIPARAR